MAQNAMAIKHREEAKQLRDFNAVRINPDHIPTELTEFQALVEREPNCALNWIAYMAYYLKNSSIPEAMAIGRQALKEISVDEPDVRLHVWSALLKIQASSFKSNQSTAKLFTEAEQECDTLKVNEVMADIYGDCKQFKEMEEILRKFTKKYSLDMRSWMMAGNMLFKYNLHREARALIDKGLLSVRQPSHAQYMTKYGELLLKYGDVDGGRVVFDKLLQKFPKKLNIWNIYIAKLIKQQELDMAREAYTRMTYLGLNDYKMKSVFKQFTEFEKKYGTPYTLEDCKKRIQNFCFKSE